VVLESRYSASDKQTGVLCVMQKDIHVLLLDVLDAESCTYFSKVSVELGWPLQL
jgi:hypothetical protein